MRTLFSFFLPLLILCNGLYAQNLKTIELSEKIGVLNDKAFFNFPQGAIEEARSHSIMAAPHNQNEETRIIYDDKKKRVVFFAEELFKIGDDSLLEEVSKGKGEILTYSRKILTNKDSIYSILSTPIKFYEGASGMLINKLIVKIQDGTLFEIKAYISPEAYSEKEKYVEFTENIFRTLSKGSRTVNLKSRTENISLELNQEYKIDLPENYSYNTDVAYDFKVTKLYKYTPYNTKGSEITFYSGSHPTSFSSSYKKPGKVKKGLFSGQEIEWHLYEGDQSFLKEVMISFPDEEMILHIAIETPAKANLLELTKIVESIKFIN